MLAAIILLLGSSPAAAQSRDAAVVCVGGELETLDSSNPARRVITEDVAVIYRVGVGAEDREGMERSLILFLTGFYFFLRELFWEPGGREALQELLAASSVLGSELGKALLVAGGAGFVASAAAYFLARDLLSWEQFRTGSNMLWRACLVLLAVGVLWSWLTSRHAPLAHLNAWFEATDATVWIVALALYMGLAWKRILRNSILVGAGVFALLACDGQGLHALLGAARQAFLWVFSPLGGGGAADLIVRLGESTGKVLGSWQGLLCLALVVFAYGASAWARRRIQDCAAAVWRGGAAT